jgi:hypothetical protein
MDIKRISPGKVEFADGIFQVTDPMLAAFLHWSPINAANAQFREQHSHLIITEDIDYELIAPSQLPPSNTNDK